MLGFSKCLPFPMQNEAQMKPAEEIVQTNQSGLRGIGHGVAESLVVFTCMGRTQVFQIYDSVTREQEIFSS